MSNTKSHGRFHLGKIVATPAALSVLEQSGQSAAHFIALHATLDPGCLDDHDQQANREAIAHEGDIERQSRAFSAFITKSGQKIWIITEADRSSTCVLLPDDY